MKVVIFTRSVLPSLFLFLAVWRSCGLAAISDPTMVSSKFVSDPNLGAGIRPSFNWTALVKVRSLVHCTISCQLNTTCSSIAYFSKDKVCHIYEQSIRSSVEAIVDPTSHYLKKVDSISEATISTETTPSTTPPTSDPATTSGLSTSTVQTSEQPTSTEQTTSDFVPTTSTSESTTEASPLTMVCPPFTAANQRVVVDAAFRDATGQYILVYQTKAWRYPTLDDLCIGASGPAMDVSQFLQFAGTPQAIESVSNDVIYISEGSTVHCRQFVGSSYVPCPSPWPTNNQPISPFMTPGCPGNLATFVYDSSSSPRFSINGTHACSPDGSVYDLLDANSPASGLPSGVTALMHTNDPDLLVAFSRQQLHGFYSLSTRTISGATGIVREY